jgi:2-oxoglutarate ferredoxin oxidoreductase subunit delta
MAKGKIEINVERCKGCELCISACPQNILELADTFNRSGYRYAACNDMDKCTGCTFCAIICPDTAITVYRLVKA